MQMRTELLARGLATTARGVHLFMLASEVDPRPRHRFWAGPSGNGNGRTGRDEMRELKEDLEQLEAGWLPSEDDLAGTPRMDPWAVRYYDRETLWRIIGVVHETARDLPAFDDGETLNTMQILAVNDKFSWARDRRGFYRLGEPVRQDLATGVVQTPGG
jgi:hypothetical protein